MKPIRDLRWALSDIPDAFLEFPPEESYRGVEPGVQVRPIWKGEDEGIGDLCPLPESISFDPSCPDDENDEADAGEEGAVPAFDPIIEIGADVDESFPALNGTEGEKIRRSVMLHGMDALAWYVSFHVSAVQWGIYIPLSGMVSLVVDAFGKLPVPLETKFHLAFHALLHHELFHFATDYAVAQSELTFNEPWWAPAKKNFRNRTPSHCQIEERLANAYMLKTFRTMKPALRVRGKQAALKSFTRLQDAGYRDAVSVKPQDWDRLLATLAKEYGDNTRLGIANHHLWGKQSAYDWAAQFPIRPRVDWRHCPIHYVNDGARLDIPPNWLNFFSRLERITETDKFRSKLKKLSPPIQNAWFRTKEKLQTAITTGDNFKKWPKGGDQIYSTRINDNFRAHLLWRRELGEWHAIEIGSHTEMGHG